MNIHQVLVSMKNTSIGGTVSYITTGSNGRYYTSSDGNTWVSYVEGAGTSKVRYLNSKWIMVGGNGYIATSTDGLSWTQQTSGTTDNLLDVAWNSTLGLYAVVGYQTSLISTILTSPDAVTWTTRTAPNNMRLQCVTATSSGFTASGLYNTLAPETFDVTSTDGITWTHNTIDTTAPVMNALSAMFDGTNTFIAGGSLYYRNGTRYSVNTSLGDGGRDMIYTGSRYVIVGSSTASENMALWHSTTGTGSWTRVDISSDANTEGYGVIYDGTKYIICSRRGNIAYSADLTTWNIGSVGGTGTLFSIAYKP